MPIRILVIDHDLDTLAFYRDLLSQAGYTCIAHTTPLIDIDDIARIAPRVIILDWLVGAPEAIGTVLPSMTFVLRVRQAPATAHLPILLCSAAGALLDGHMEWFRAQGVTRLDKPFDIDVLLERIA